MKHKLATRGSKLALWQAHFVGDILEKAGVATELMIVKTSGDKNKDMPLSEIGGKGVFVKELEHALVNEEAELAVHCLKDLPAETRKPFDLPMYLKRHPAEDVIVFNPSWASKLSHLDPEQSWQAETIKTLGVLRVGTGSLRRESLLKEANPDIQTIAIRGNVDTRLAKLKEGNWDAIILAKASIYRLPLDKEFPCFTLDRSWFVPCAGQGALVVETLDRSSLRHRLQALSDARTEMAVTVERKILAYLGGDCNLPVGVHVFENDSELCCDVVIYNDDGKSMRMYVRQGEAQGAAQFAELIWNELRQTGVESFLQEAL